MTKYLSATALALALGSATASLAQPPKTGDDYAMAASQLDQMFDAYPAEEGEVPAPSASILTEYEPWLGDDPDWYREPNFAGRYHLTSFGCGTECQSYVLVNPSDPEARIGVTTRHGADFRLNSRLLIANSPAELIDYGDVELPETLLPRCYLLNDEAEGLIEFDCGF
jgi:hypothetical protein